MDIGTGIERVEEPLPAITTMLVPEVTTISALPSPSTSPMVSKLSAVPTSSGPHFRSTGVFVYVNLAEAIDVDDLGERIVVEVRHRKVPHA